MENKVVSYTSRRTLWVAWLVAAILGIGLSLQTLTYDEFSQSYFLLGIDSFYHAARIQDVVSGVQFYEWDFRGFSPNGAWVAWPWVFDRVLIVLSGWYVQFFDGNVLTFLVHTPPFWFAGNLALFTLLCIRSNLHPGTAAALLFCFALLPFAQQLHLAGRIDHHFAELTAVLVVTLSLLNWIDRLEKNRAAFFAGLSLALVNGISNGLFILQIPVLMVLGLLWLSGGTLPKKSALIFAATLSLATLLQVVMSEPFWAREFDYFVMSGFHAYIAVCTSLIVLFFAQTKPGTATLGGLLGLGLLLSAPVIATSIHGLGHLGATRFNPLETASIFDLNLVSVLVLYSPLIFFAPIALLSLPFCSAARNKIITVGIFGLLGLLLLIAQTRFAVYGVLALLLPLGMAIDFFLRQRLPIVLLNGLLLALCGSMIYVTAVASAHHRIEDWNPEYFENLKIYQALGDLCEEDPGLALVHPNQGHYVLFHSNCSVVSNNATISPRHIKAREQTMQYLEMEPTALLTALPDLKFIAVTRYDGVEAFERPEAVRRNNVGMYKALLIDDLDTLPPRFELLGTVQSGRGLEVYALSRLFRIKPVQTNP